MITISGRNVNHNYATSIAQILDIGDIQDSRAGQVLVAHHPVMTVTNMPRERVLFCPSRDANPFFHFFECLWMMSGSRDGRWLDRFVRDFSSRFGDAEGTIHGAYGHRWREWPHGSSLTTFCQLNTVVHLLQQDRRDRRVVISMWDPSMDLDESHRDVPCNTHIYPRIVHDRLDLTVCCRSNDIIWGATGANAVHFSFLQEWIASRIGVGVGRMYQLSNNWHAYTDVLKKLGDPSSSDPYVSGQVEPYPIMDLPEDWDDDLVAFMEEPHRRSYLNSFFGDVALPLWRTHELWREGSRSTALAEVSRVQATDWRLAAQSWMERRLA